MVALALLASPVDAQPGDARTAAPVRLGPFAVTPVLELTQLGVDTNVFYTERDPESDFVVSGGPKVDIALPLRQFTFTAETTTTGVYYQTFTNQRGVNVDLNLRGQVEVRRLTFFVEDAFVNTRERPNLEIDIRARRVENRANAGATVRVFRKLEIDVAATHSRTDYDGDDVFGAQLATTLNREAFGAVGELRYAMTPLTTMTVQGEIQTERFDFTPSRDNDSWSIVPGVEFHPRAAIAGSARVGYRNLRGRTTSLPPFSGPVAIVDLAYTLLGVSTVGVTASRDVEFLFEPFEPYYVSTGYGVRFGQRITDRFGITVGTRWVDYDYRTVESGGAEASAAQVATSRGYSLTLLRRLTRSMDIGFAVSHVSRRSNRAGRRNYDGLLTGLTSTFAF